MVRIVELEQYAKDHNVPIMIKEGIDFLCEFIKKNNIKNVLEIGSAIGYSSIKMALIDPNITITTIEKDKKRYEEALENIKKFNLQNQIKVIFSDALEVELNEIYDLIFIDAAKSKYIEFFCQFQKNLKDKGYIITDNLDFHGLVNNIENVKSKRLRSMLKKIEKYIKFLKENNEFETEFVNIGDGISITKFKNNK